MTTLANADRPAVVVNDGDLRFRVRPQPIGLTALANARELATEPMREHDRRRHQFRRVVAGKTEHETLISRALLGRLFPFRLLGIDTLRDVR